MRDESKNGGGMRDDKNFKGGILRQERDSFKIDGGMRDKLMLDPQMRATRQYYQIYLICTSRERVCYNTSDKVSDGNKA